MKGVHEMIEQRFSDYVADTERRGARRLAQARGLIDAGNLDAAVVFMGWYGECRSRLFGMRQACEMLGHDEHVTLIEAAENRLEQMFDGTLPLPNVEE